MSRPPRITGSILRSCALVITASIPLLAVTSCGDGRAAPQPKSAPGYSPQVAYGVEIRRPNPPPAVAVATNETGVITSVQCGTCHATRPPNFQTALSTDLDVFHQGLNMAHGSLSCLSCHDFGNYDRFRLAGGASVDQESVMKLCAQCHGPQMRDYNHGAHGGMSGHWDLSKGGRVRNSCLACHDPHSPKFQGAAPALPPLDRFLQHPTGTPQHD